MPNTNIRKIAFAGAIGALYATLTLVLHPISYGPLQFRIAEALTVLPFFFPSTVWGLFVGCIIANLGSPYGIIDIIAGPMASLLAGFCTMKLGMIARADGRNESALRSRSAPDDAGTAEDLPAFRNALPLKILACAPPVVFNAVVIGAMIAWFQTSGGPAFWPAFVTFGLQVGLGQLAVLYVLGLPLMLVLPRLPLYKTLSGL